ncbi:hypothetical protein [Methanoculleus sp. 10]|mgnify:FL=1|jgi:hypothetical protein|uniref:hypothetical protein n=1 Tax=Methanoculleus sp. 10 TaxID=430615 RepID=UPI001B4B832A|nr:hypothetical protein [Methanoculleus sp. 10]MBP7411536.1 hypothetical protein [Methanoculleus sp.]
MKRPAGLYLAYLFQFLIAGNILIAFSLGEYSQVFGGIIALGLTMVPAAVTRRGYITLPWEINLLVALSLYLHIAGGVRGFYEIYYPYYDKVAHLISGITVSVLAFVAVLLLDRFSRLNLSRRMIVGFVIIFAMAMEGFWEIYEWTFDTFLGTTLQHGLDDTMLDMIFVLVGAVAVALAGNRYLSEFSKEELTRKMVHEEPRGE